MEKKDHLIEVEVDIIVELLDRLSTDVLIGILKNVDKLTEPPNVDARQHDLNCMVVDLITDKLQDKCIFCKNDISWDNISEDNFVSDNYQSVDVSWYNCKSCGRGASDDEVMTYITSLLEPKGKYSIILKESATIDIKSFNSIIERVGVEVTSYHNKFGILGVTASKSQIEYINSLQMVEGTSLEEDLSIGDNKNKQGNFFK